MPASRTSTCARGAASRGQRVPGVLRAPAQPLPPLLGVGGGLAGVQHRQHAQHRLPRIRARSRSAAPSAHVDIAQAQLYLLIGSLLWSYLSLMFFDVSFAIAWERWEGTIEYTFMAPVRRVTHLLGICSFAIVYAMLRSVIILVAIALAFHLDLSHADIGSALLVLAAATLPGAGPRHLHVGPAAALTGEGRADGRRGAGRPAPRLGRVLPDHGAAGGVPRDGRRVAADLHAHRDPRRRCSITRVPERCSARSCCCSPWARCSSPAGSWSSRERREAAAPSELRAAQAQRLAVMLELAVANPSRTPPASRVALTNTLTGGYICPCECRGEGRRSAGDA